jgi:hypothetical protein
MSNKLTEHPENSNNKTGTINSGFSTEIANNMKKLNKILAIKRKKACFKRSPAQNFQY